MRNIFIFWCVATLASTGCASAAPSPPVSVAPEPVIAGTPPETAAQQPAPKFRQELAAKAKARAGAWVGGDGTGYSLSLNGDRLTIKTNKRLVPQDEAVFNNDARPNGVFTPAEYQLTLRGNHLSGTWNRGGITNLICTFPPDTSEVTGELNDKDGRMVLHHDRTSYHAYTQFNLFGNDACTGVNASVRGTVDETIYGPLAKGGVGIELYGLTGWYDGGFSDIRHGWQGRLRAAKVRPGTPAFEAGMQDGDEILAIDGVAVKSLSAGQAVVRLHGEPGSTVTLELWRKDNKTPFTLTLRRIDLFSKQPN